MTPLFTDADGHEVRSFTTSGGKHLLTSDNAARVILNHRTLVTVYGGFALVDLPVGHNVIEFVPTEGGGGTVNVSLSKLHPVENVDCS
ncbi:hypothetical protein PXK30_09410 [Phaeobacter gallaeciensis]|uniref:hypothetical protein n=1 Tax=Phaeobacter gallaeciensis TaxID=60890 RepID=UPI00237F79F3|nr:hypothetical protein [Phaeobacter gallaeciensis]MDE4303661.1 hypothetical protein [Phaeobacter gallaeciensis]MDE4307858.1 hypothetical protein [Phaeobacter gallaeciensis]MDE4312316.1 hypothetical protein [Phaeobacter gallaeciensis]MDE4316787.1 hypothetical protein [Phaeobacter gallaeciensis]MDE4321250.1 hypothetical protein [Phaeobacter gallaeciensis]